MDKDWFEKELTLYVTRHLGEEFVDYVTANQYFVDFMRDAPETTGDWSYLMNKLGFKT